MKEKIIEILKSNLYGTIGNFKDCANKIESLYKDYYPKEFVEWLVFECDLLKEASNPHESQSEMTDRLYDYWLTNIKDK